MKRKLSFIILLLSSAFIIKASQADSIFYQANEAYAASKFSESIDSYEGLIDQGYFSAELYFNLGNAYYKNNNISYAILNYERAKMLDPNNEDINFNLKLANTYKVDQIEELPRFFLSTWTDAVSKWFSFEIWGKISLLLFIGFAIVFLIFLFTSIPGLKKTNFVIAVILLVLSITTFTFANNRHNEFTDRENAIITTQSVTVKSSPDESGNELFVIHEGTKVKITETIGDWFYIRIADGNMGWVLKNDLEVI